MTVAEDDAQGRGALVEVNEAPDVERRNPPLTSIDISATELP